MTETLGAKLPRRQLGKSGLKVPTLALGGAGIGGVWGDVSEREAIEAVLYAVAQGVDYLDTDASYGDSERRIGLALAEGDLRQRVTLSTKTGTHPDRPQDYSWDGTLWNVENSLRLLKTDHLDLVLVHDPHDMTPVLAPRGALTALQDLKRQGVIGSVGLGQRDFDFHRQAIEAGLVDVILTYKDYNPIRTTAAEWLLPLAKAHDVGVINGSPLAMGLLAGDDPDKVSRRVHADAEELDAARQLYDWCHVRGVPEKAVTLQFCLRQPQIDCTLTGAKTRQELEQDLKDATLDLTPDLWDELAALHVVKEHD